MINHKLTTKATLLQLLNVQAHIGNKTSKWNPFTKSFLFGIRYQIHIFDLKQTSPFLKRALFFLTQASKNHQLILFIGSHPIVTILIKLLSENTKQASISRKWISGTLTNWLKIRPYIKFLYTTNIAKIRQKFILRTEKKIEQKIVQYLKMKFLFSGIERMPCPPNLVILLENEESSYPLTEAVQLMLPVFSILNTGPKTGIGVTFPIFGNDYLFDTLFFYTNLILQAIRAGYLEKRLAFLTLPLNLSNSSNSFTGTPFSHSFFLGKTQENRTKSNYSIKKTSEKNIFKVYREYKAIALKRVLRLNLTLKP